MMNAFPPFGVLCASPMLCHVERQHSFFLLKKKKRYNVEKNIYFLMNHHHSYKVVLGTAK